MKTHPLQFILAWLCVVAAALTVDVHNHFYPVYFGLMAIVLAVSKF